MATTKKKVTKKTVAKAPVKKKSASVSKSRKVAKKSGASKSKVQSFKVSNDYPPFRTFQITRQTVYWVILVAFIVFAQLWIISLQIEVASLIDAQQALLNEY